VKTFSPLWRKNEADALVQIKASSEIRRSRRGIDVGCEFQEALVRKSISDFPTIVSPDPIPKGHLHLVIHFMPIPPSLSAHS
jgi:hypothetical protein